MEMMFKDAVIDIGSNSVRLMLPSDKKIPEKQVVTTRLAFNAKGGFLDEESILRTASAVIDLYHGATNFPHENIFIFATEAVRSALNASLLLDKIKRSTGIDVDVISGDTEAKLGYFGAKFSFQDDLNGVLDIGGASTELIIACKNGISFKNSLPIGAVRLSEKFHEDYAAATAFALLQARQGFQASAQTLTGISGTFGSLAAMFLHLKKFDAQKVHGFTFTEKMLDALVFEILPLSPPEIIQIFPCVHLKRAAILKSGCAILKAVLSSSGAKQVRVCSTDNLEGYLIFKNRVF